MLIKKIKFYNTKWLKNKLPYFSSDSYVKSFESQTGKIIMTNDFLKTVKIAKRRTPSSQKQWDFFPRSRAFRKIGVGTFLSPKEVLKYSSFSKRIIPAVRAVCSVVPMLCALSHVETRIAFLEVEHSTMFSIF